MLFLGCERENVQLTNDECYKHEALELFLKDYVPREDSFRDRIVNGVIAKNESNGMIYDLANRYGQPLWGIERTATEKSISTLLVPITHPSSDSITAVMMFTQSANSDSITYRIVDNNHRDTLVTDFLLYCQTVIYGRGFNPNRTIKPIADTKDFKLTITGCWNVYTGNLTTQTYSYSFCTYRVVELPTLNDDENGGSSGTLPGSGGTGNEGGGGSGGTGNGSTTTPTDCSRGMILSEKETIDATRSTISSRKHCPSDKILNATSSILYEIDPCMTTGTYAEYTLLRGTIQFREVKEINEARLYEEMMHAYQDIFYRGLSKYGPGKAGYTNMEFEAKVMYAIYWYQKGLGELPVLFFGMNDVQQGMFMDWFDEIIRNGATDSVLTKYNELINLFNTKNPTYANCISQSFPRLSVIIHLLEGCSKL